MSNSIEVIEAKAFINQQPIQPTSGGTLHVITSIESEGGAKVLLNKRVPQGINPEILLLDYEISPDRIRMDSPQEVRFSEDLEASQIYTSVELHFQGEELKTIEDVEIVV